METAYSVEEDDDDDGQSTRDHLSRARPSLLKTPSVLNAIIDQIHPEIVARSHQSNFVLFPPQLENCVVVDLGCGVGRDAFILSKLVGENGRVIGIDSDKHQLDLARHHIDYHVKKFGLTKSNVDFVQGEIDQLDQINLPENTVDVVVSNSVINHRRNKKAIIEGVCRILKPGGEFYFSDVYANRTIPVEYQELLAGEYVGGALRWEDLILYATDAGFTQPRLVIAKPLNIGNEDIQKAVGQTRFVSAIFRCFKLPSNDENTDFAHLNKPYQLTYERPLSNSEEEFFFDHSLQFKLGELLVIDDPTITTALSLSRYRDNFTFDPIEDTSGASIVITETFETLPSSSASGQVYRKTTTVITTTDDTPND